MAAHPTATARLAVTPPAAPATARLDHEPMTTADITATARSTTTRLTAHARLAATLAASVVAALEAEASEAVAPVAALAVEAATSVAEDAKWLRHTA